MACRASGRSTILLCLGLFLVASHLCHCKRLTKLKALDKLSGNSTLSRAKANDLCHGRLLIGQNSLQGGKPKGPKATKNLLDVDAEYQADKSWGEPEQPKGWWHGSSRLKPDNAAVERILKMEPQVECTGDSMKLQVLDAAYAPGSLFFVDRGSLRSLLPLSKLLPSCGYTIRSTRRDLVLVASYDGCFVALEEESYVLALRWCGLPVRMSCPLRQSSPNPPMVTCHAAGMVVKMEWTVPIAKIQVNVTGVWEPLMEASPRCGFSVVSHPEGVVISVSYAPCLERKDGMYTLELAGDGETKISCPLLSLVQPEPTKHSAHVSKHPEVLNKKPYRGPEDITQPQSPYFAFDPNFFYPYLPYPDTKPTATVQPPLPVTKTNGLQSQPAVIFEGQVPQPLIPLPFYPWPAQPEVPVEEPVQPPATQQPNDQVTEPLYTPIYVMSPKSEAISKSPAHESQNLEVPNEKPYRGPEDITQPQSPYFAFDPNFFYPYLPYPDTKPIATVQPPLPVTKTNGLQSQPAVIFEGQVPQPLIPLPFYPWPAQPEVPVEEPVQPPATQQPNDQVTEPLYTPIYVMPPNPEAISKSPEHESQNLEVPNEKPNQGPEDITQPQSPYFPFDPNFFYPYPPYPDTEPPATVQPPLPVTKTNDGLYSQQIVPPTKQNAIFEGHVPQPLIPLPFYPWPAQPVEKPNVKPPATQQPNDQVTQPLNTQFYESRWLDGVPTHKPQLTPLRTMAPLDVKATRGQRLQPFYTFPFYPQPPKSETTPTQPPGKLDEHFLPNPPSEPPQKPVAQSTSQPEGQQHEPLDPLFYPHQPPASEALQVEPPYTLYSKNPEEPLPKQPVPQKPPVSEESWGQMYQAFYPYPFYSPFMPDGWMLVPTTWQTPTPTPKGHVQQPLAPSQTETPEALENVSPCKPLTPQSKKPPQPEAPQGQVQQLFYPKHTTVLKHPATETAEGQEPKPYPQPSNLSGAGTNGGSAPTEQSVQSEQPPPVKSLDGQVHRSFNPYYFPQQPYPVMLPPATSIPQQVTTSARDQTPPKSPPSNGGIVPQGPQPDSPYMQSVYCPEFCPPGLSNCCPQIAFHQHLYHIVPAGPGSKDAPRIYSGLSFPSSVAYSGFDDDLIPYPLPQKPTEAMTMQATSAPILLQSLLSGNEKQPYFQPPHGTLTNPEQMYPYVVPNSLYTNWPYLLQNLPPIRPPDHYNMPSKDQDQHKVQRERHNKLIPYYMFQDALAPTYKNPSQLQPFLNGSKKSTKYEKTLQSYPELKRYMLLQHGPPGKEPISFNESPLPFGDLLRDTNFPAQNLAARQHPKNLKPPQKNPQYPKWLGRRPSNPLPGNVYYMPRPADKSETIPFSALDGPHFVPLPQHPSLSAEHLKPKFLQSFQDFWKPMTPLDSSQRIPPHVLGNAFQQWHSAADD